VLVKSVRILARRRTQRVRPVIDQYTGRTDNDRYTLGRRAKVNFKPSKTPLTDNDIIAVVHAVASHTGETGHGHIYHVFLPGGTDECFDNTFTVCYSPDNPKTWFFCASTPFN